MPPRRTFLLRRVKHTPPDEQALQKYLQAWRSEDLYHRSADFPRLTSPALFGDSKPLELEVGCGTGEYLNHLAAANPNRNYVGLDVSLKSLYVAVHEAVERGLENVRFIKAALQFVYPLLEDSSLQAIYVHFPEPILHPKFRKRRLFNHPFLQEVTRALAPGGLLSIVTDSQEMFGGILTQIEAQSVLRRTHEERYLLGFEPPIKSRYQQYWEGRGVPIYRLELVKSET
jgi:tRNA (guanine-N7-)-methyltransferase